MMVADSVEQQVLAVDKKPLIWIKPQRPNSKGRFIRVCGLAGPRNRRHRDVAVRLLSRRRSPKLRIDDDSVPCRDQFGAGPYPPLEGGDGSDRPSAFVITR